MLTFVNAKLNLGLYVTGRRPDGYHDLSTLFYPVGLHSGTPENPEKFCDVLEVVKGADAPSVLTQLNAAEPAFTPFHDQYECDGFRFLFGGRKVDCPPEKNLVVRGALAFAEAARRRGGRVCDGEPVTVLFEKYIPDGAGLGGGSADCSLLLKTLNSMSESLFTDAELIDIAARLGADCPFFILNTPAYAEGIGERLSPVSLSLQGMWCVIVKPDVYVSTAEAFRGVRVARPEMPLLDAIARPIDEWRDTLRNAFEETVFPLHPELPQIKVAMYEAGAHYAAMSGSGSSLFGIFSDRSAAESACEHFRALHPTTYICLL